MLTKWKKKGEHCRTKWLEQGESGIKYCIQVNKVNCNITPLLDLKHWRRILDKCGKSEVLVGLARRLIDVIMGRVISNIIIVIWRGGAR